MKFSYNGKTISEKEFKEIAKDNVNPEDLNILINKIKESTMGYNAIMILIALQAVLKELKDKLGIEEFDVDIKYKT